VERGPARVDGSTPSPVGRRALPVERIFFRFFRFNLSKEIA